MFSLFFHWYIFWIISKYVRKDYSEGSLDCTVQGHGVRGQLSMDSALFFHRKTSLYSIGFSLEEDIEEDISKIFGESAHIPHFLICIMFDIEEHSNSKHAISLVKARKGLVQDK